jgi:hypothetical protein
MLAQLQKLLDGEKNKFERNGVVFKRDNDGVVSVVATGLFTNPVSFTLNDTQLRLLNNFIDRNYDTSDYDVYLVKLNNGIRLAVDNEFEQLSLDLLEDGTATAFVGWGSADYWDKWVISNDGSVRYIGTVDGYRRIPEWVELALPVEV